MDFTKELAPLFPEQTPAAVPPVDAPIAVTPPSDVPADIPPAQTPPVIPPADAPPAAPATPTETAPDFNSILDKMSGGVIKDEATLKEFLPKISEYTSLKQSFDELSAQMAKAPKFADDEVRILNELKAAGASKEQIKSFQKINEYGTIAEMPDRDARIAKMVMIDGVKPSVAELKVDREFKLNDDSLSDEEKEILTDDLRVAAMNDKKALEQFKAQVSQATAVPPEEVKLQQQAKLMAHQAQVKPYVNDVMTALPHLGIFTLGMDGDKAIQYEMPIDATIKAQLGQYVENYFMDGLTPVTPESTREALSYARAEYWRENAEHVLKAAYEKGVSLTTEKLVNKYENRSGLKQQEENPVTGTNEAAETAKWMANKVNRVGV